jgi:hypothetical protein
MRREILAKDVANREQLYADFLKEVGNIYFDSVKSNPRRHVPAGFADDDVFACRPHPNDSCEPVLTAAETLAEDIVESLQAPSNDLSGIPTILGGLQSVARVYESMKACRAERQSMLGRL